MEPSTRNAAAEAAPHVSPLVALEIARRVLKERLEGPPGEEQRVVEHIQTREPISTDPDELAERSETTGARVADAVARVGGSWGFIGAFFLFLAGWVTLNSVVLAGDAVFDHYPYVFLNLCLSMLAAIQAPIIMMSQNRQAAKDRVAAEHDYEVNLRSEIEILAMQHKLDRLRNDQHQQLLAQNEEILRLLRRSAADAS